MKASNTVLQEPQERTLDMSGAGILKKKVAVFHLLVKTPRAAEGYCPKQMVTCPTPVVSS